MKNILIILVTIAAISTKVSGQSDPLYAQYLFNPIMVNPAYAGFNNHLSANAGFRKQWAGFEGSPTTVSMNAHSSLLDNKMGLGIIILKDQIGASDNTEAEVAYSYRLHFGEHRLSFGLQAGLQNFRIDHSSLNPYDPTDPIFYESVNTTKFNIGAGLILSSDRYFLGLSVPRLLQAEESKGDATANLYSQHVYLMGAYAIYLNHRVRLKPSTLVRATNGGRLSADINLTANIDERYSAGVFTRGFNTGGVQAFFALGDKYRFGYALEIPFNRSVGTQFTTHEVTVGFSTSLFRWHDRVSVSVF